MFVYFFQIAYPMVHDLDLFFYDRNAARKIVVHLYFPRQLLKFFTHHLGVVRNLFFQQKGAFDNRVVLIYFLFQLLNPIGGQSAGSHDAGKGADRASE